MLWRSLCLCTHEPTSDHAAFRRQELHLQVSVVSYRNCLKSSASVPLFIIVGELPYSPGALWVALNPHQSHSSALPSSPLVLFFMPPPPGYAMFKVRLGGDWCVAYHNRERTEMKTVT